MKIFKFILIFTAVLIFAACGGGESSIYDDYPDDGSSSGKTDKDTNPDKDSGETDDADTQESDTDGDAEINDDGDTQTDDTDTGTDTDTDTGTDTETDTAPDTETDTAPDTETDTAPDTETDTAPDTETDTGIDTDTADTNTDTDTADTATDTDTADTNTDTATDTGTDTTDSGLPEGDINFENAIFVSANRGNDSNNGTKTAPFKTLAKAVQSSTADGKNQIIIANGYYDYTAMKSGISIFGGYYFKNNNWVPIDEESDDKSVIAAPANGWILNGLKKIKLSNIAITSYADSAHKSAIGLILNNCNNIMLQKVSIITSNAVGGEDGENGLDGANGENGGDGNKGCEYSSALFCSPTCSQPPASGNGGTSTCGANGGNGGRPGEAKHNGYDGEKGVTGESGEITKNGGLGGTDKFVTTTSEECDKRLTQQANGGDGEKGETGEGGQGGKNYGTFSVSGYTPSDGEDGAKGKNGQGGGGGGGGRGGKSNCDSYGSSGGGGGAGGCGGLGGKGGKGGGASVPLIVISSDNIYIEDSRFEAGNGGNGGKGGNGGAKGRGGIGGIGGQYGGKWDQDDGGCGGGPSVCLVNIRNSNIFFIPSQIKCLRGESGKGGNSSSHPGATGFSGDKLNID